MDFLPSLTTILAFSAASILLAATPGPDMTLMLGRTLSNGRKSGFSVLLGTAVGCLVHTVLAVVGISALLAASTTAFLILKTVGALYLLWLAFEAIFKGSTFSLDEKKVSTQNFWNDFLTGLGVNVLNPKVVIFFLTFLPQFISANDPNAWQKMLFLGVLLDFIATPIMIVILLTASEFANTLKANPKISRIIDYVFGSVFAVFAVRIFFTEGK
jgi:threonine/homoserine/homoserine lactone efflux protein